jgi:hypothetical protein
MKSKRVFTANAPPGGAASGVLKLSLLRSDEVVGDTGPVKPLPVVAAGLALGAAGSTETLDDIGGQFDSCLAAHGFQALKSVRGLKEAAKPILYKARMLCNGKYGLWKQWLEVRDFPRSTADEWAAEYAEELELTAARSVQDPDPQALVLDPQAAELTALVQAELANRAGKIPTHHQTQITVKIRGLRPDQTARYHDLHTDDPAAVKAHWYTAFLSLLGFEFVYKPEDQDTIFAQLEIEATNPQPLPEAAESETTTCIATK